MENPLYKHFTRTGCKLCPYKSQTDWWKIYHFFRDDWNEAKQIEEELIKNQKEYCYFIGEINRWESGKKHF